MSMSIPPLSVLESTAKKLVWDASKKGALKEFTPRLIRQAVEKELGLEAGVLDTSEYRGSIKSATKYALENDPPTSNGEGTHRLKSEHKSKRKSSGTVKAEAKADEEDAEVPKPKVKVKAKSKAKVVVSDEEPVPKKPKLGPKSKQTVSEDEDEAGTSSPKKALKARGVGKAKAKKVVSDEEDEDGEPAVVALVPKSRTKKDSKVYKSLEHVPTSDMEQDEPIPAAGPSVTEPPKPITANTPRKAKVVVDSDSTPGKPLSSRKTGTSAAPKSIDFEMEDDHEKGESELSVEPPKRKRKSGTGDKASKKVSEKSKSKRAAKSSVASSKDEETIKRLKSLVVACGMRKVWSKVFQDLDGQQQQIKKLREILADLGMTGRLSMEQAKAIKEKRELAKELADVTEFAAKIEAAPRRGAKSKSADPVDDSADENKDNSSGGDEEEVLAPRRPAMSARKSIMAFLDDQSDDE